MNISVFYEHIAEAAEQTGKSILDICKEVVSFGISGVEIEDKRITNNEEILKELSSAGLVINCIYAFFDFGNHPDTSKGIALLDMASKVGASKVLVIPGFIHKEEEREQSLSNMKQVLIPLCEEGKRRGILVGMEDFDDQSAPFSTIDQLLWFMENVPNLSCAFDTGNFLYSEEDVLEAYSKLKRYIGSVHCKDRSLLPKEKEEPKLTVKGRALYSAHVGAGCIPMKEIVTDLIQNGYCGSFAIEHFGSKNQLDDMKKSAEWLINLSKMLKAEHDY